MTTLMTVGWGHGWVLWLLPLALLPLIWHGRRVSDYSTLTVLPTDPLSSGFDWALRLLTVLALAALIIALAAPFRPTQTVERIGQGAQLVLLLDRSRSMDQSFGNQRYRTGRRDQYQSKGHVARQLLSQFVASRHDDLYGMMVFSARPIQVLPLTQKQSLIQAAIAAGNLGRGLSDTDVGAALEQALMFFEGRPYTGSRIVLLVSDGGAQLALTTRTRIKNLFQRQRAALYWIYIRSYNSPGLEFDADGVIQSAPEQALHQFFQTLNTPYRVYTAEDPEALARAIADVNRLQNLPIRYEDQIPKQDLAYLSYGMALVLLLPLLATGWLEHRTWQ